MSSINKVFLLGNLGHNPDYKVSSNGNQYCKLSLATNEQHFDKASQETKKLVTWHNVIVFGKTAEACSKHLTKGSSCMVEGKITHRSYEKDGQKRTTTDIISEKVVFLGSASTKKEDPTEKFNDVPF